MLISKSEQLIQLSKKYVELHKYSKNQQGFKSREEQITQYYDKVLDVVESLRLFRNKGLISGDFAPVVNSLLNSVQLILQKYQQNPEWIIDNKNFNRVKLQSSINQVTSALKQKLLQAWQNYLDRNIPRLNQDLLNILYQVSEFQPAIKQINQLNIQINRDVIPKYRQQFDNTERLIQQLNETWNTLNAENFPEDVLKFLKAAGSNTGASFDLLTPSVETWIKERNLSNTLRIRLK